MQLFDPGKGKMWRRKLRESGLKSGGVVVKVFLRGILPTFLPLFLTSRVTTFHRWPNCLGSLSGVPFENHSMILVGVGVPPETQLLGGGGVWKGEWVKNEFRWRCRVERDGQDVSHNQHFWWTPTPPPARDEPVTPTHPVSENHPTPVTGVLFSWPVLCEQNADRKIRWIYLAWLLSWITTSASLFLLLIAFLLISMWAICGDKVFSSYHPCHKMGSAAGVGGGPWVRGILRIGSPNQGSPIIQSGVIGGSPNRFHRPAEKCPPPLHSRTCHPSPLIDAWRGHNRTQNCCGLVAKLCFLVWVPARQVIAPVSCFFYFWTRNVLHAGIWLSTPTLREVGLVALAEVYLEVSKFALDHIEYEMYFWWTEPISTLR